MKIFIVLFVVYFMYRQQQKENFRLWTAINSLKYRRQSYGDLED